MVLVGVVVGLEVVENELVGLVCDELAAECNRECVLRLLVELNRLLHTSHWCGFSPVCTK